jgi:glycogen operon protein
MRNLLATLILSQGVPMLLAGDEIARSQNGNNNAYCQDNETSWLDWDLDERESEQLAWTQRLIELRRNHPVLRRRNYFQGRPILGAEVKDIAWLGPDGRELVDDAWHRDDVRAFAMWLAGAAADLTDDRGNPIQDDTLVVLLNPANEPVEFRLPPNPAGLRWSLLLDSARPEAPARGGETYRGAQRYPLREHSIVVLGHPTPTPRTIEAATEVSPS